MKTFWVHPVQTLSVESVALKWMEERQRDARLKWVSKMRPSTCLVSNIFPLHVVNNSSLFQYDINFHLRPNIHTTVTPGISRARSSVLHYLRSKTGETPSSGAFICVANRIYSTVSLPQNCINLPEKCFDLNISKCTLTMKKSKILLHELPMDELQQLCNRLLNWSIQYHGSRHGNFRLCRSNGKVVDLSDGCLVSGIRIHRGTQLRTIFVKRSGENEALSTFSPLSPPPSTRSLATLNVNTSRGHPPIVFQCAEELLSKTLRNKSMRQYLIRDASGSMTLTDWDSSSSGISLKTGNVYRALQLRIKLVNQKYDRGNFGFEAHIGKSTRISTLSDMQDDSKISKGHVLIPDGNKSLYEMGVRVDTLCTVAKNESILEEIVPMYGLDMDKGLRDNLRRELIGTPVVNSLTLTHGQIMDVTFDDENSKEIRLERDNINQFSSHHEYLPNQPRAVLQDLKGVPLQVLHRSYNPNESWMDAILPTCSLLPPRRLPLLQQTVRALQEGLQHWGLQINEQPIITKDVAAFTAPLVTKKAVGAKDPRLKGPHLFILILIGNIDGKTPEILLNGLPGEERACWKYSTFDEAINALQNCSIYGACTVAGILANKNLPEADKLKLSALCLRRGMIPVHFYGRSPRNKNQWLAAKRLVVCTRSNGNPLSGFNLSAEVPRIGTRMILFVGIDVCHTRTGSTGALVGTLYNGPPLLPIMYPFFWHSEHARNSESDGVLSAFYELVENVQTILSQYSPTLPPLSEIMVMQDGSVRSEIDKLELYIPQGVEFSFINLHKRTGIRFTRAVCDTQVNCMSGQLVRNLIPSNLHHGKRDLPGFFLQSHNCALSTARTLYCVVQRRAHHWDIEELNRLCFVLSFPFSTMPSKLPFPTRCAHHLAAIAHELHAVDPEFQYQSLPLCVRHRMWFSGYKKSALPA